MGSTVRAGLCLLLLVGLGSCGADGQAAARAKGTDEVPAAADDDRFPPQVGQVLPARAHAVLTAAQRDRAEEIFLQDSDVQRLFGSNGIRIDDIGEITDADSGALLGATLGVSLARPIPHFRGELPTTLKRPSVGGNDKVELGSAPWEVRNFGHFTAQVDLGREQVLNIAPQPSEDVVSTLPLG